MQITGIHRCSTQPNEEVDRSMVLGSENRPPDGTCGRNGANDGLGAGASQLAP